MYGYGELAQEEFFIQCLVRLVFYEIDTY